MRSPIKGYICYLNLFSRSGHDLPIPGSWPVPAAVGLQSRRPGRLVSAIEPLFLFVVAWQKLLAVDPLRLFSKCDPIGR
jgi:hypothetical protein